MEAEDQNQQKKKTIPRRGKRFTPVMQKRLFIFVLVFTFGFAALGANLIRLNVVKGETYSRRALAQQVTENRTVPFKRGDIFDCNGTVLATSETIYNLILEPATVQRDTDSENDDTRKLAEKRVQDTGKALADCFQISDADYQAALKNKDSYYEVLKREVTYSEKKNFEEYEKKQENKDKDPMIIGGITFETQYKRVYPNHELACHVVGFVNGENQGYTGVEGAYNTELNGENGRVHTYLKTGNTVQRDVEPASDGHSLVTTIDTAAQQIVQENVEQYERENGEAKNISVLVMNPKNCEILALYNKHQYDPNDAFDFSNTKYQFVKAVTGTEKGTITDAQFDTFKKDLSDASMTDALNEVWGNDVISNSFEPGSTFKCFTIAGALEDNVVTPDTPFYCDGGQQVEDYYIRCHAVEGAQTTATALEHSCNDSLMQIAALEGRHTFYKYQQLFGFGQKTNIDIAGEPGKDALASMVFKEDELNPVELATSSFGQGVTVTMMQLGTAFCSIVNGGFFYQPHVVKQILDADGNLVKSYDKILVRRTISRETSDDLRTMLKGVVTEGTGQRAAIPGYSIGGKTGTAEKLPRLEHKYILSFIGFAPVEDPQVVVYCAVDEPNDDEVEQSATGAGPVLFHYIAEDLFPYLNIPRTEDSATATDAETVVPQLED